MVVSLSKGLSAEGHTKATHKLPFMNCLHKPFCLFKTNSCDSSTYRIFVKNFCSAYICWGIFLTWENGHDWKIVNQIHKWNVAGVCCVILSWMVAENNFWVCVKCISFPNQSNVLTFFTWYKTVKYKLWEYINFSYGCHGIDVDTLLWTLHTYWCLSWKQEVKGFVYFDQLLF